jgi:hypothetical protein
MLFARARLIPGEKTIILHPCELINELIIEASQ